MKSAYAPLPFSYLSSDAKPKVGLRKDGVYGTSADVPRFHQPETQDQSQQDAGNISLSTEYPYSVYANASSLNQGTHTDYRSNNAQQQTPADHHPPIYSQNGPQRLQEATPYRPQKPEGGFLVYPPSKYEESYIGRNSPKEEVTERKDEPPIDYDYPGLVVAKRPQEQNRSNAAAAVGRAPSHYPPAVGNNDEKQVYETINGVESPSTYTMEPKQKQPKAVIPKDFDNFILVKDPNRPDSVIIPDPITSANKDPPRRNNNLQTLFEADEPRKQQQQQTRYNALSPENHYVSSPSKEDANTRHNQGESGFDRSGQAIYHGPQKVGPQLTPAATNPEPPTYRENGPGAVTPDSHHSSDARLVKDSTAERNRTSGCGKCSAVVIAVIVTAIICLGAGFIAGWFGAKAAPGNDACKFTFHLQLTSVKRSLVLRK